jgi:hypothetical protein
MSKQRQAGTSFESSLLPLLRVYMPEAHRLGMQGAKDKGDFYLPDPRFVIEAKNYSSYAGKLAGWLHEAHVEAGNADKPFGIVCFKRRGTTDPKRQFVLCELLTFLEMTS